MMFKINIETTFDEILRKSIEIWSNNSNFSLYDDAFNNLDCCGSCPINDFFFNYTSSDSSLKQGEIVFYLIEKLVNQKQLLELQEKSIDSKSEAVEDNDDKGQGYAHQELEESIKMIKEGKILKGIGSYQIERIDEKKLFKNNIKIIDNSVIFMIVSIIYLCLSVASFAKKKDINNFFFSSWDNKILFENIDYNNNLSSMYNYLDIYKQFIDLLYKYHLSPLSSFIIVGNVRIRFLMTYGYHCLDDFSQVPEFKKVIEDLKIVCISDTHTGIYIYKDRGVYTYKYSNSTNIERTIKTPIGYYDNTGIIIDINLNETNDYNKKLRDIKFIIDNTNNGNFLNQNLKAMEMTFTNYYPESNIYVTNLILVEVDSFYKPTITIFDSISFKLNFYKENPSIYSIDIIRLILLIILIFSFIFRFIQKYKSYPSGIKNGIKVFIVTTFQIKNILLISSFGFYVSSFNYYNNLKSKEDIDFKQYNDFYFLSDNQKNYFRYDVLSFLLIGIYSLKYFQIIGYIQIIFNTIKKAAFEYIVLFFLIAILFVGMSLITFFVYCSNIIEYKSFLDSLITNIKIFIFEEDTVLTYEYLKYNRAFSIIILLIFIFFIRFFLLNLFYSIFIEYFRIEIEKLDYSRELVQIDEAPIYTFKQKLIMFFWPFYLDKRKKEDKKYVSKAGDKNNI